MSDLRDELRKLRLPEAKLEKLLWWAERLAADYPRGMIHEDDYEKVTNPEEWSPRGTRHPDYAAHYMYGMCRAIWEADIGPATRRSKFPAFVKIVFKHAGVPPPYETGASLVRDDELLTKRGKARLAELIESAKKGCTDS
jgi:hypothetical protein